MKKKSPLVVGLVGTAGSGKSTAAVYMKKKYKAEEYSFSSILIESLSNLTNIITRKDLIWYMMTMKKKFGENILTKAMERKIKKEAKSKIVVVSGMRLPTDYDFIRSFPRNKIIFITAPIKTRWKRVKTRGEKSDDNVTFKEFKKLSTGKTELFIEKIGKKADYTIENDGGIDKLRKSVDKIVKEIA